MSRLHDAVQMVVGAQQAFDEEFSEKVPVMNTLTGPIPIACKVGCSFCCHLEVTILPAEALTIGMWIHSEHPEKILPFQRAVRAARIKTEGMSSYERKAARILCPFLENNQCGIYRVRPLACRAWISCDVQACEADYNNPAAEVPVPSSITARDMSIHYAAQMSVYANNIGIQADTVELIRTMDSVLNDPSVPQKVEVGVSFL